MQIHTVRWSWIVRAILWLLLVGLPLLLYLLLLTGDLVASGPLLGDFSAVILSFGWPVLLAAMGTTLVILIGQRLQSLRRQPLPSVFHNWWSGPVIVGLGAYLLGCLLHRGVPLAWWHWYAPNLAIPGWEPLHWWPLSSVLSSKQPQGWTIMPPLFSDGYALIPSVEASAIKLGALLATLLLYYRRFRRVSQAPPVSPKSVNLRFS
jgi:hypothetical protein